jgi:hypothetical protein
MPGPEEKNTAACPWPDEVALGIYANMPVPLSWEDSNAFVYLLNGYTAMGPDELGGFANKRVDQARKTGVWTGSVRDLWLCLFYEKRRWRHFGDEPTGPDRVLLDALCEALRQELVALDAPGRGELTALIAANPCPWHRRAAP